MNDAPKTRMFSKRMKILLIVLGLVTAAAVLVYAGLFWTKTDSQTEPEDATALEEEPSVEQQPSESSGQTAVQTAEDIIVETPFCALCYPGNWGGAIRTESDDLGYGYVVRFYGTSGSVEAELFSAMFGYCSENAKYVGTFMRNGISTDVYMETAALVDEDSWATQDADQIRSMQTAADYVIEKLKEDPFFCAENGESPEIEIPSTIDVIVDTPYCVLQYPAQWQDAVQWEVLSDDDRYDVVFNGTVNEKEYQLFTFSFGSNTDSGFQVGIVQYEDEEVEVYLTLYDAPSEENWTDEQRSLFKALQDQAYSVLEKLPDNPNYSSVMD